MNKQTILVLLSFSVTLSIIYSLDDSFAQSSSSNIFLSSQNKIIIFVQTFLYNSEGKLVTYLTADKFTYLDLKALNNLLNFEESENDPIINVNGQKFQVIRRQVTIPYDKENVIASTIIAHSTNGTLNMVARFAHDGYPILNGEKVTTVWTFVRPVT